MAHFAVDIAIWWGSEAKSSSTVEPSRTIHMTGHPSIPAATVAIRFTPERPAMSFKIKHGDIHTEVDGGAPDSGDDDDGDDSAGGTGDGDGGRRVSHQHLMAADRDGATSNEAIDSADGRDATAESPEDGSRAESSRQPRLSTRGDHRTMDVIISLVTSSQDSVRYTSSLTTVMTSSTKTAIQACVGDDTTPRASASISKKLIDRLVANTVGGDSNGSDGLSHTDSAAERLPDGNPHEAEHAASASGSIHGIDAEENTVSV